MAGYIEELWLAPSISLWRSRQRSKYGESMERLNRNSRSLRFVDFALSRVRMLIHFGITPYLVFDGDYLPSKAATEISRAKRREESKRLGLELHKLGKTSQAHLELQKAVDVTPQMARQLIEELKELGVQYLVAPYEADAQLAYLERKGIIHGILSEDSDLLVFGAKSLLTKLDQYGDCIEINRNDFTACREISLVGWKDEDFRRMAILSGCDYLASINKMGLKTAYRLVRKHKTIERILRMLQFDGQYHVPAGYLEAFRQAELTFLHQRVFCPLLNSLVLNTALDENMREEDLPFIGGFVEQDIAVGVARGDLHPMTKLELLFERRKQDRLTTPRTTCSKRQTSITQSSELKVKKPIDSFFKPRRTPLAELDPNSFTPSPSQQRVLQRDTVPWSSSPAPRSNRSPLAPALPTPQSQPARLRPANRPPRPQPQPVFTPYPSKRQRLCSDVADEAKSLETLTPDSERSRFFASTPPGHSSSIRKGACERKPKQPNVNIWSDDSIDEALAGLPDVSGFSQPTKPKKLAVFAHDKHARSGAEHVFDEVAVSITGKSIAQSPTTTTVTPTVTSTVGVSQSIISHNTPQNSRASSVRPRSAVKSFDDHLSAELKALKDRFSYQPLPENCVRVTPKERKESDKVVGRRSSFTPAGRSASRVDGRTSLILPESSGRVSTTPLQRFAADALRRPNTSEMPTSTEPVQIAATVKIPPVLSSAVVKEVERSPPPPQLSMCPSGSEDLIVPDSENESDGIPRSDGEDTAKPILDLKKYAFNAA